ncbi:MAG: prepilin peptidase [Alphaproteobacteria bacterium]|nr:prepilin peptidase [Alphaproteobacteria bacterium]
MTAVAVGYIGLFIASAVTDVLWLRIPNVLVLALVALFALACVLNPPQALVWNHIAPAVVVFALMTVLFVLGQMGGGDVKLLAAAVLWAGFSALGPFLIALAVYGLGAILIFTVFRAQVAATLAWAGVPVPVSLETGKSIPYGVVIAAAALSVGPGF